MGSNRPCSGDRSLGEAGGGDEPVRAGVGGGGGLPELLGGVGQPVGLGTGRKRCYERIDISLAATPATGQTIHKKYTASRICKNCHLICGEGTLAEVRYVVWVDMPAVLLQKNT